MGGANTNLFILSFLFFSLFSLFPHLNAVEHHDDDDSEGRYWDGRAKQAQELNKNYFHPNPYNVSNHISSNVVQFLKGEMNSTRRGLANKGKKGEGPCKAANPIDKCWRCDPEWADNRKKLADCAQGFGRKATGGKNGRFYVVTDPSDDDLLNPRPGTLRHAVIQKEPLWITFARSMIITLQQELIMTGNKTIDGRGANVHISGGAGITIQFISNVIIHNIHIHDIVPKEGGMIRDSTDHFGQRTRSDGDGISIFGASNIWIDHNSMYKCTDGLIDIIQASTGITISNNHFTDHNEAMLFGANDVYKLDKIMQVTVAFNHFGKGLVQRMPRCRFGFFHIVNNDYTHWLMYAIGGSQNPTIISEGNRFIATHSPYAKEVTKREYTEQSVWKDWQWKSIDDEFIDGAFFVESGPELREKQFSKLDMIPVTKGVAVSTLTREAGTLNCRPGKPC